MLDNNSWEGEPKFYTEDIKLNWFTRFNGLEKYFTICVVTGSVNNVFVVSPPHLKQLVQMLTFNLKRFEEENGVIPVEWKPLIVSDFFNEPPSSYQPDKGKKGKK
jgi:hypothetical protein